MLLIGDIGGTNTRLAFARLEGLRAELVSVHNYPTQRWPSLEAILEDLRGKVPSPLVGAAFGIAGPVVDNVCRLTNVNWVVDGAALARALGLARVPLLNDLEIQAYGLAALRPEEIAVVNAGVERVGHQALIAAGTGLGEALLIWEGRRHVVVPTEGGHADFGPRSEREVELWRYVAAHHGAATGRVTYERMVSGPGLVEIYSFLKHIGAPGRSEVEAQVQERGGAAVTEAALSGSCPRAREAAEWFLEIYGAEAGNLALKMLATAGVWVGGGIAASLLPLIQAGSFMRGFAEQRRFEALLRTIPVRIILNDQLGLLGAARVAAGQVALG